MLHFIKHVYIDCNTGKALKVLEWAYYMKGTPVKVHMRESWLWATSRVRNASPHNTNSPTQNEIYISFDSGIVHGVFDLLKIKVANIKETDRVTGIAILL